MTNTLDSIKKFINEIGINCIEGEVRADSFLPGVDIVNGCLVYKESTLLSPGDLLHEAGHIAVLKPTDRACVSSPNVNGDLEAGGAEMAAIAWSWAALQYLDIDPAIVFHSNGYHNGSESIIENFSKGHYFGVSLLQWFGMTTEKRNGDGELGSVYPEMKVWLRP